MIEEVAGSHQEEYMPENYRGNKYFLMNVYTKVRKNGSVTTIWLCKCPKKGGDKSLSHPLLNPPPGQICSYSLPEITSLYNK